MGFEVVAIISPKAGKEDRVRDGLKDLAGQVQAHEPGATRYQIYEQTGAASGTADFVVVEEYADEAAYKAHATGEFLQSLGKLIQEEDLLAKPLDIKTVNRLAGFWSR